MQVDMYTSTNTGDWIKQLNDATLENCSWKLSDYGTATISADPLSPDAIALSALNAVEVQIWLDEQLAWWGIPRRVSGDLTKLSFECEDLLSEFLYSFLTTTDRIYNNLDQKNIMAALVTYAQSLTGQSRNIVVGAFSPSGINRTRNYLVSEYPNIYELIKAFADLKNGLDFGMTLFGDGRREFTMYYPGKGSVKPQYALELDQYGRKNITGLTHNKDAMGQANDLYLTGELEEVTDIKLVGRWTVANFGPYGRRQNVLSEGSVTSVNWLNDRAEAEGIARSLPVNIPEIMVSDSLRGKLVEGDTVPIRVDYGAIQMSGNYQINEVVWEPGGSMKLLVQPA